MATETLIREEELAHEHALDAPPAHRSRFSLKSSLIAAGILALVAVGAAYYARSLNYESTDNASFEGNVIQVSPRVAGQVAKVYVQDNQHVNKGDLLVEIDPADYDVRLAEAQARLTSSIAKAGGADTSIALTTAITRATLAQADAGAGAARNQVDVLRARLQQEDAGINAARAQFELYEARRTASAAEAERAAGDAARYQTLYQKDEVSKQMLDRAVSEARATAANSDAASRAVAAAKAQLAQATAGRQSLAAGLQQGENQVRQAEGRLSEAEAAPQQVQLKRADAAVERARLSEAEAAVQAASLSRSYTRVYATESGYITRKSVEVGNFVGAGQALMALVSDHYWVVANFKETQLTRIRPGQLVVVKVDAYPNLSLKAKVDSIQSGTGARFSMMPAENATGNFVKVVQRVPVKIVLLQTPPVEYRLGPGMSVEPEVDVR